MVSAPIQRGIRDFWPDSVQRSATDFPWFYRSCAAPNSWPHGATKQLYILGDQGFKCSWEIRIMSCITQVLKIHVNHSIAWHFEYFDGTACFTVIIKFCEFYGNTMSSNTVIEIGASSHILIPSPMTPMGHLVRPTSLSPEIFILFYKSMEFYENL